MLTALNSRLLHQQQRDQASPAGLKRSPDPAIQEHYRHVLDSDYSDALAQESADQKLAQNAAQLQSVIDLGSKFSDLVALANPQQFLGVTNYDNKCTTVHTDPVWIEHTT